jgi:hypothetical protein
LCEKVTGMPNGAASGVVGVELVRESWTGWSCGAVSKPLATDMKVGWSHFEWLKGSEIVRSWAMERKREAGQ